MSSFVQGLKGLTTNAADADAIAYVAALIHREGGKRTCKCEKCRCIARVIRLARKAAKR